MVITGFFVSASGSAPSKVNLFTADDVHFKDTGRIDLTDPHKQGFPLPEYTLPHGLKGCFTSY